MTFLYQILSNVLLASCLLLGNIHSNTNAPETAASDETVAEDDWIVLFDGSNTDHWRGYNMDAFPQQGWGIEANELVFRPVEGESPGPLDIITKEKFSSFELVLEWNVSEGGNSGIFHHIVEQPGIAIFWSGIEMQILDNDAYPHLDDNQLAGSLYEKRAANPQNTKPHGTWNTVRIVSDGPTMEYWQNGEKVVEFERWTVDWYNMIRGTKFECHPSFGNAPSGHIGLQDHGDVVRFRDIRVRRL